jgi:murein L,D-transpeptidase YcbB/YkuD
MKMKRFAVPAGVLVLALVVFGCSKKENMEQSPESMTMDELGTINNAPAQAPQAQAPQAQATQAQAQAPQAATPEAVVASAPEQAQVESAEAVKAAVSSKAAGSPHDIQAALKNAGFYNGNVDGKIGPMTKKAIMEFQKANKLKADGKVGPKTWEALSRHLGEKTQAVQKSGD